MSRKGIPALLLLLPALALLSYSPPAEQAPPGDRAKALQLKQEGNFKEAWELFSRLTLAAPEEAAENLADAVLCLRRLGRRHELDRFLEKAVARHPRHRRLLTAAAQAYHRAAHYGYLVAGEFHRGRHRGGGRYVQSWERDRTRALQLLQQAMAAPAGKKEKEARMHLLLARILLRRGGSDAWRLGYLTDLEKLPDYTPGYHRGSGPVGAPVDEKGDPLYHHLPASWEKAQSDGERWRWALLQAMELDPELRKPVRKQFASFLLSQFGVQTMASFRWFRGAVKDEGEREGILTLHRLTEEETVARLATGVKRFTLPEEFNYIRIFREIGEWRALGAIFENRRQYPKAAECWEKAGQTKKVKQIRGNWGRFENTRTQPAGDAPQVGFRFRNGAQVELTARKIDIEALLKGIKDYLKSNPAKFDWRQVNLNNLGRDLVERDRKKYVGGKVASWSLELKPRPHHFDKLITINTPLQEPGAYLLTAAMKEGNRSTVVVWVDDTAIVQKRLDEGILYYLADSRTGKPVPGANVEFFGYDRNYKRSLFGRGRYVVETRNFAEFSDDQGMIKLDRQRMPKGYNWLAIARTKAGRLAFQGFNRVWYRKYDAGQYDRTRVFAVTDRPVYRPGQKVKYKFWLNKSRYDREGESPFAGAEITAELIDPAGKEVFTKVFKADRYGGFQGEFSLEEEARLGRWRLRLAKQQFQGERLPRQGVHFRVEEYKKPEFQVKVKAPEEPVMLGEKIEAKVEARYYFGAPVTEAEVKYKVLRTAYSGDWYPPSPWDWLYGGGYWWFGYDYNWYPGWRAWGCPRPAPWWFHRSGGRPEVVAQGQAEIGRDGTFSIPIDTNLAKEVHGDSDHRYQVTVEVRDRSRRTIVGQGSVLVARRPFKVHLWVDRGHYRVGDPIMARFRARRLDGKGVPGKAVLKLFKITYQEGKPVETPVNEWRLEAGAEGTGRQQLKATATGQYRLSCTVTDTRGHAEEGAYIFCVRGEGFQGGRFRFNDLELVTDKKEYAPGEKVNLMVNTDRADATVLLFIKPVNGTYLPPKLLRIADKSVLEQIPVTRRDMPNFFIEALTVAGGRVLTEARQVVVPPEKRILKVAVEPSAKEYEPGAKASLDITLTDHEGKPFAGQAVVTIYDKSVEYISGGSNVPEIKAFFWKWKRRHNPLTYHNLGRSFANVAIGEVMSFLGVFGRFDFALEEAQGATNGAVDKLGGAGGRRLESESRRARGGVPTPPGAPVAGKEMERKSESLDRGFLGKPAQGEGAPSREAGGAGPGGVEPKVRTRFADTALWVGAVETGADGTATVEFTMPENLTTWKSRVWAMGDGTRCGQGTAEAVTTKKVLLRLQAPRFFVQKDEVVLSANVHNYLAESRKVKVALELDGGTLTPMNDTPASTLTIAPGGEERVDWRVKVVKPGEAVVRMKALAGEYGDAMQVSFPVLIHGMLKMESFCGVIRPEAEKGMMTLRVPAERLPGQSRLEVRWSPSLAAAMVDALPYLVNYPHRCTEQTLNRFLPTVITHKIITDMGVDLEAVRKKRTNLNAQEIGDDRERAKQWRRWKVNPVFDPAKVKEMTQAGLEQLAAMQCADGGWGWFSGWGERSWPHTTAVVVQGLQLARESGVAVVPDMLARGVAWLKRHQARELQKLKNGRKDPKVKPWKSHPSNLDAFVYLLLVKEGSDDREMLSFLYEDRNSLSVYGKGMLGLACHRNGEKAKRDMLMRNIEQYLRQDEENQTAWLDLPNNGYWWYWYGSEYEAHAAYLRLLAAVKPRAEVASRLVKYLLNNRKHATYWKSTRDTAYCLVAFAAYLKATGEHKPEMTVQVLVDGKKRKQVEITGDNLFLFDNKLVLAGEEVATGEHRVELVKQGRGTLYYNAYLTNFTLEDPIKGAGLEIKVRRNWYKLTPVEARIKAAGSRGQAVDRKVEKYERTPVASLDRVKSGDLLEIELVIESKNDYEYIVFEDMKAAGCEPVDLRSGYTGNEMGAYMEFRDEKVCLFVRRLARGRHSVSYRVRAEIPGRFHALPTKAAAMYAPELKANSDELKLVIVD